MKKLYDFHKAKSIIEKHKDEISSAYLGMLADWYWTADEVFGDGEYTEDLNEIDEIGGIPGSDHDIPTLRLYFKDGKEQPFDCYKEVGETEFLDAFEKSREKLFKSMEATE